MEAEIEHRKVVVRKELLEHVKVARAQGDLSENFEYYAAKKEKNANESRIRYLERMIRTAKIIDDTSASDEVGMNKTVRVRIEEDGSEATYNPEVAQNIVDSVSGVSGTLSSLPGSFASAVARALSGVKVYLDGEAVGRLTTNTVSMGIAGRVISEIK